MTTTPVPGRSRTRATASLRRPVVWMSGLGTRELLWIVSPSRSARRAVGGQRPGLGLLGGVGVLGTAVDAEPLELLATERSLGQHAAHGQANHALGVAGEQVLEGLRPDPARVARVAVVGLVGELARADGQRRGVDDDDVVAAVEVRRPGRLVLAPQ